MAKVEKTIMLVKIDDSNYEVQSNFIPRRDDKVFRKHAERFMRMLLTDNEVFNFFYSTLEPVIRFKRREARKKAKEEAQKVDDEK